MTRTTEPPRERRSSARSKKRPAVKKTSTVVELPVSDSTEIPPG
jgi:hypothetical protein